MKKLMVALLLMWIIMSSGCEPSGGGSGYQYLGISQRIIVICDANENYTTTVVTKNCFPCSVPEKYVVIVRGRVDINKKWFYVWLSTKEEKLRVRYGDMVAEHYVLMHYGTDLSDVSKN